MGILVLEPGAGDQLAGGNKRVDHRLVGFALAALVVYDELAFKARRIGGEGAVFVDRIGDRRRDAARFELAAFLRPDVEILAAMAGCGVDETGTVLFGDVLAFQQRDGKILAAKAGI